MKLKHCKIGDVVDLQQGLCINKKTEHLLAQNGIPLLRITDLINGTKEKFINKELVSSKFVANKNDIIYTRTGQVGLVFKNKYGIIHNNCFKVFSKICEVENNYIYWFLRQNKIYEYVNNVAAGAAQPDLNHDAFKSIDFIYPSKEIQRKIVKTLSNYDDLIENNNRRIKILEEMAQKIYKEWFVDFKFPGHETTTFKASPLGKIPNDWEVKKIGKEYKTYLGGTPSRNEIKYWNGDIPWLNSGKTNELRITEASEYITKAGLEKSSTKLMPKFTTVLAITGATLGQVSMLGDEMCANQSVVGVYSNTNQEFVFYLLKDKIKKLIQNASGGAQQHINKDIVNEMEFILPTNNILNDFTNILKPINLEIFNLLHKNRVLKQTRNILLPRLISGEINVENMEVL